MSRPLGFAVALLATALFAAQSGAQNDQPVKDPRLDLFVKVVRDPSSAVSPSPTRQISQTRLEQLLRIFPAAKMGHGTGQALSQSSPGGVPPTQDPSTYGFCYEACRTERAVGSCGTAAPGETGPPQRLCDPIEDTATLRAIIGPSFVTSSTPNTSPFVDDNTGPDGVQPAGYTFLGQFIDHDVTRTTNALAALGVLDQSAQSDPSVRTTLAAAGITPELLHQAVADAAAPGSALSANSGKLDLDAVYGVSDFATLTGISAPWFEQVNGFYTGRFAMREVAAPNSGGVGSTIDGFDYQRTAAGAAEVPDPRNSENKLISQLQNLFELAHNECVDRVLAGISAPSQHQIGIAFDACHHKVAWTYETIVATDFLPRISTEPTLNRVAPGALHAYVRGTNPTSVLPAFSGVHTFLYSCTPGRDMQIPHEFAVAAFGLGHSLVRDDYLVRTGEERPIFAAAGQPETEGLVGDNLLQPRDVIDWRFLFDIGGETAQAVRPLDTLISDKLFSLPLAALPPGPDANGKDTSTELNLPRRNLLRASEPTSVLTGAVGLATGEETERYAQRRIHDLHELDSRGQILIGSAFGERRFQTRRVRRAHTAVAIYPCRGRGHSEEPAPRRTREPHRRRIPARLAPLRPRLSALYKARRPLRLGAERSRRPQPALFDAGADHVSAGQRKIRRAVDPPLRPLIEILIRPEPAAADLLSRSARSTGPVALPPCTSGRQP